MFRSRIQHNFCIQNYLTNKDKTVKFEVTSTIWIIEPWNTILSCYPFVYLWGETWYLNRGCAKHNNGDWTFVYRWYVILNPSMTWWNWKFSYFNYFREEVNIREIFINIKWPHYLFRFIIFCLQLLKMFW